jgi:hypothetical protein
LSISEDSADAWLVLGESTSTPEAAIPPIERAVEVARRALGAERFAEFEGHFRGHVETRPCMRARLALTEALLGAGRANEATFKAHGDRPETHAALEAAARVNPYVIDALLDPDLRPVVSYDSVMVGGPDDRVPRAAPRAQPMPHDPSLFRQHA